MISGVKAPSKTAFVSLIAFYIVLVVFLSLFFWFIIGDIASGAESRFTQGMLSIFFYVFALVIVVITVAATFYTLIQLIRLRKNNVLYGGMKLRLMGYFSGFAFLLTIPQILLAVILIFTTTNKWLSSNTQEVIAKSRNSLMMTRDNRMINLREFSNSQIFFDTIRAMLKSPASQNRLWRDLVDVNHLVSGIQVFSLEGDELLFLGDLMCKTNFRKIFKELEEGELPVLIGQSQLFLRYLVPINLAQGEAVKVVVSFAQPISDNNLINDLTLLSEHYIPLIQSRYWIRANIILVLFLFILIINFISIYLGLYISNMLLWPIIDIEEAIKKVASGDFSIRLYSEKENHFSMLVTAFNKMIFDLEKLQKNSTHFNKMKAWQDIARRMAHEINNPLTPIRMSAERMVRQYKKNPENFENVLTKSTQIIIDEVENLKMLLHDFRAFSRLPEPQFEKSNLYDILVDLVALYRNQENKKIQFSLGEVDQNCNIVIDKMQIRQVFSNLIKNSVEAIEDEGYINFASVIVRRQNIKYCRVILEDSGKGIPAHLLDNIFTPYFTTKEDGTGLGLSIVERIIFAHKGKIRALSKEGDGTTFVIDLPMENEIE